MEALVVQRLLGWLSDKLALLDALSQPSDDAALAQTLLAAAGARCSAWPKVSVEQVREVVRAVVVKITIGPHSIAIALSKSALRALLLGEADNTPYEPEDDLIKLSIDAGLRRRGCAIHLVVSPDEPNRAESQDQLQLLHTLARAYQWRAQFLSGEVSSLRMVAKSVGKSERYVGQVIRAAFLAPDLVETLLQGRSPRSSTWHRQQKTCPGTGASSVAALDRRRF